MLCYLAFYSDIITSCQFISSGSNGIQIGFLNLHERGSAVVTQSTYLRTGISIIIAVTPLKKVKLFLTKCNRKKNEGGHRQKWVASNNRQLPIWWWHLTSKGKREKSRAETTVQRQQSHNFFFETNTILQNNLKMKDETLLDFRNLPPGLWSTPCPSLCKAGSIT